MITKTETIEEIDFNYLLGTEDFKEECYIKRIKMVEDLNDPDNWAPWSYDYPDDFEKKLKNFTNITESTKEMLVEQKERICPNMMNDLLSFLQNFFGTKYIKSEINQHIAQIIEMDSYVGQKEELEKLKNFCRLPEIRKAAEDYARERALPLERYYEDIKEELNHKIIAFKVWWKDCNSLYVSTPNNIVKHAYVRVKLDNGKKYIIEFGNYKTDDNTPFTLSPVYFLYTTYDGARVYEASNAHYYYKLNIYKRPGFVCTYFTNKMTLLELIEEVKSKGEKEWTYDNYSLRKYNCQSFVIKLIEIMGASYDPRDTREYWVEYEGSSSFKRNLRDFNSVIHPLNDITDSLLYHGEANGTIKHDIAVDEGKNIYLEKDKILDRLDIPPEEREEFKKLIMERKNALYATLIMARCRIPFTLDEALMAKFKK